MLALFEQLLSILFEVMQAVVSHPLTQNTAFIYALLYAREDLTAFAGMPRWAPAVEPLLTLVSTREKGGCEKDSASCVHACAIAHLPSIFAVTPLRPAH